VDDQSFSNGHLWAAEFPAYASCRHLAGIEWEGILFPASYSVSITCLLCDRLCHSHVLWSQGFPLAYNPDHRHCFLDGERKLHRTLRASQEALASQDRRLGLVQRVREARLDVLMRSAFSWLLGRPCWECQVALSSWRCSRSGRTGRERVLVLAIKCAVGGYLSNWIFLLDFACAFGDDSK